jgi:outer membrane protein TolC
LRRPRRFLGSLLGAVVVALPALPVDARPQVSSAELGESAAPSTATRVLSLAEAIAVAAGSNPVLVAARQRAAAANEGARATERGVGWPRLAVSSTWSGTDTPASVFAQKLNAGLFTADDFALDSLNSPSLRGHLSSALALEYPIDAFRKFSPLTGAARASADAVTEGAREIELEVRARVVEAWHRAAVAEHAVLATERAAHGAAAREEQIEAQVEEGAALRADLLRARARRRSLEADLAARRGDAQSAAAALAFAIGSPGPVAPALETATDPAVRGPAPNASSPDQEVVGSAAPEPLVAWLERAGGRPVVAAARAALAAAEQSSVRAARTVRPDLALSAQLQDDRGPLSEGQTTGMAGLYLRWELFDPQRRANRAVADLTIAAADADLAAALAQARFEIESAWHAATAARERWQAARGGSEEGREALRVVGERRAAGLATLTDELETEAAALAAELVEFAAVAETEITRAALERAAGVGFLTGEAKNP